MKLNSDLPFIGQRSSHVTVRLDPRLLKFIDKEAKRDGIARSGWIRALLTREIHFLQAGRLSRRRINAMKRKVYGPRKTSLKLKGAKQ
jgi:hypothetical protein